MVWGQEGNASGSPDHGEEEEALEDGGNPSYSVWVEYKKGTIRTTGGRFEKRRRVGGGGLKSWRIPAGQKDQGKWARTGGSKFSPDRNQRTTHLVKEEEERSFKKERFVTMGSEGKIRGRRGAPVQPASGVEEGNQTDGEETRKEN